MGGQNAKQIQGQSPVQIDHPKFENAKILEQKGNISILTTMGIEERQYNKWKQQISALKMNPDYLLMPKNHQFISKGFCGSAGTLNVIYEYFPYLLMEQIENRKKRKSKFQQCELWFLLFSLSAAQIQMKKVFDSKVGDIRPQNIFINQEGQIKVSCLHSWPGETSNFQKTFEHLETLLAPEDMNKLQLGGMDDPKNYQSEMFSIGMTILGAALLTDFTDIYDVKKFKFRYDEANDYLHQWRINTTYSEIFTAFISNLCSFEPEKRLTEKELWSWINKYEEEIKNKDDFVIEHAPLKIEKEIQELRGESNINMLQEPPMKQQGIIQPNQAQIPFQEKSIVFPFMQGQQQDPRYMTSSIPPNLRGTVLSPINTTNMPMTQGPNMVMSPREAMNQQKINPIMESVHHNIPTAESMYTQVPPELYQKQFVGMQHPMQQGQLPPGIIQGQLPPGVMPGQIIGMPQGQIGNLPPGVMSPRGMQGFQGQKMFSPPPQQFLPPGMVPQQQGNGNFVYTRRIIDPKNNSVVAEQRIGQEQFQRGMAMQQGGEQNEY